jgi:hypothetical protein
MPRTYTVSKKVLEKNRLAAAKKSLMASEKALNALEQRIKHLETIRKGAQGNPNVVREHENALRSQVLVIGRLPPKRGGRRDGAGRKPVYKNPVKTHQIALGATKLVPAIPNAFRTHKKHGGPRPGGGRPPTWNKKALEFINNHVIPIDMSFSFIGIMPKIQITPALPPGAEKIKIAKKIGHVADSRGGKAEIGRSVSHGPVKLHKNRPKHI